MEEIGGGWEVLGGKTWEALAAVGRDGRCKGEAQLAGGGEGRSETVGRYILLFIGPRRISC